MTPSTPTHVVLARVHAWITREGRGTDSARVLRGLLLSMAGVEPARLVGLQVLDATRRAWVAELVRGYHRLRPEELISAAGGRPGPGGASPQLPSESGAPDPDASDPDASGT